MVWMHEVNLAAGRVSEPSRFSMERRGMHPRHLVVHLNERFLYVLMEADNSVAQFDLDAETGLVVRESEGHARCVKPPSWGVRMFSLN